jgi:prevent-host-death family protein
MLEVALYEAKNKLSGLLDEVAAGKQITITRHGKAAARLVPAGHGFDRKKAKQAANALLEARRGVLLDKYDVEKLLEEGQ